MSDIDVENSVPVGAFTRTQNQPDASWLAYLSRHKVSIDSHRPRPRDGDTSFRVLTMFSEPSGLMAGYDEVVAHAGDYDLILTHQRAVCEAVSHAVLFPFGSRWVPKGEIIREEDTSFIFSEGGAHFWDAKGYEQRRQVLERLTPADAPRVNVFFSTKRYMRPTSREILSVLFAKGMTVVPLGQQKLPAFESRYQIVIENTAEDNYFTEKIMDCFTRKVTPIYIGCPNIGDYFDKRGVLHCKSVDDIFEVLTAIDSGEKLFHPEAIAANYEIADYYDDTHGRVRTTIEAAITARSFGRF